MISTSLYRQCRHLSSFAVPTYFYIFQSVATEIQIYCTTTHVAIFYHVVALRHRFFFKTICNISMHFRSCFCPPDKSSFLSLFLSPPTSTEKKISGSLARDFQHCHVRCRLAACIQRVYLSLSAKNRVDKSEACGP